MKFHNQGNFSFINFQIYIGQYQEKTKGNRIK